MADKRREQCETLAMCERKNKLAFVRDALKRDIGVFALLLTICGTLIGIGRAVGSVIDKLDEHEKQISGLVQVQAKNAEKLDRMQRSMDQIRDHLQILELPQLFMSQPEGTLGTAVQPPPLKPHSRIDPFTGTPWEAKATPPPETSFMNYPTPK